MKINAELVFKSRANKSWSQEELALASGLNIRTIQRIEREGIASLQSKKALASVFGLHISDLDSKDVLLMKKYEYKTLEIQSNEGFLSGIKKQELPDLSVTQGMWSGKTGNMLAVLQREITDSD